MKHLLTRSILACLVFLVGCSEGGDPEAPASPDTSSSLRTVRQAMTPLQDSNLWATPAGASPAGNNGGPTSTCELEVLREQFWTTTPPNTAGSGVTLDALDTFSDGLYSQSLMVRCGPFITQTPDPDCRGSVIISSGANVIGVSGDNSDSQVTTTDTNWGLAGVDYTASSPKMENNELISVVQNGDGTTTVNFTCSLNQTPYTDTFRLLIDHGTAFREVSATVNLTAGADINVGGQDGGGQTSVVVPLTNPICGNGIIESTETCDDNNNTPNDGCDATCNTEADYTCPTEGGPCLTVDLQSPVDGQRFQSANLDVSGTATAGATVTVVIQDAGGNTVATETVTADGAGAWSATNPNLAEGDYTVSASVTTSGGTITDSVNFTIDDTDPVFTFDTPADNAVTNDNTPTVSGTVETDSTVTVRILNSLGVEVQSLATSKSMLDWTVDAATLMDGTYTFEATATDSAGNTSVVSHTVTIDTADPSVTLLTPANNSSTNDTTPTVSGTAEIGVTVTVEISDAQGNVVETQTPAVDGSGNWTFDASALADGDYTVSATATDAAGNNATAGPNGFSVDTADPVFTFDTPADNAVTNDATPTVSGTVEAGSNVDVRILDSNGNEVQSLATLPDLLNPGSWTTDTLPLADGTYTFVATARDAAGNSSTISHTVTIDTNAPAVAITDPADNSSTNDNTPTVSGTAEVGAAVTVTITDNNGNVVETQNPTVDGSGNWTFDASALADGDYTITATATDAAGNNGMATGVTFTVDTTAPTTAITTPADNSTTGDGTPTISGTVSEPGAAVTVTITDNNGNVVETQTPAVDGSGNWTFDASALGNGDYTITASATDDAGNTGADSTSNFTVDATAPSVSITAPADNANLSDTTPTVSGNVSEPGATVTVTITDSNGNIVETQTPVVDANGDWSFDAAQLAEGTYTAEATAVDNGGNTSTPANVTFTVDTSAPSVTLDTPADNSILTDNTPTISGTAEVGVTVTVEISDAQGNVVETQTPAVDGSGNWTFDASALADGDYTVSATATDTAGNSATAGPNGFSVDTAAPVLTVTTPADGASTNDDTPTIQGTIDDPGATVTVVVLDDQGNAIETLVPTVDANGDWSVDASQLAEGTYAIEVTAADAAGNASNTVNNTFTIDLTDPTVSITGPADGSTTSDDTPTITGMVSEPGAVVTVEISDSNGNVIETLTPTVAAGGGWSVDAAQLADGAYTVTATATDAAGNTSAPDANGFTVDTSAPSVSILTPASGTATNDATPTVSGTAAVGAMLTVTISDAQGNVIETQTPVVDVNGDWSFDAAQLADGSYTIEATATDIVGNSASTTSGFEVDTTSPGVTLDAPADGSLTNDDTPTISGTTDEPGAAVTVTITDANGNTIETLSPMVDANGNWSIDASQLPEGAYTATATATDAAGNDSQDASSGFTVDLTGPGLNVESPIEGQLLPTRDVNVNGSTEADAAITVEVIDAAGNVIDTVTTTADDMGIFAVDVTDLANGDYTFRVTATDAAGNETSENINVTVDSEELLLDITAPVDGSSTSDNTPTISGVADPDATVEISIRDEDNNEVEVVTATVDAMGNFTAEPMTNLEDGDYTFVVTSTRPSGKQATEQVTVTIDTTAPTVTITSPADGMTSSQTAPTITGTADPGATVEVTILDENGDIIETLTTTADANGDFSVDASDLGDGTYTVEVTATDEAGNQGSAGPNTLIIDTEAPEVTITSPMMGEELDDSTPTITGTGEPGSTVEVFVDGEKVGEVVVDENGDWSFTVETELSTGEHTIEATTTDEAGNTGSTGEVTIIIGGSGTTVTNPTPGGEVTGPDVTVNGTGTPGDTITVTIGDRTETVTVDENGDWSVTVTDVPEGDATIVVTDGSGQTTEVEVTVVYPVDVEDNQYLLVGGCSSAQGGQPTAPVELLLVGLGLVALRRRRAA